MSTESMNGHAEPMASGRSHTHQAPSRTTRAARSLLAADRLPEGSQQRAEAFGRHMQEFAMPLRRTCPPR